MSAAPQGPNPTHRKTSGPAVLSFVLGVASLPAFVMTVFLMAEKVVATALSISLFGVLFPAATITAIVTGITAIRRIGKSPGLKGLGFAIAGIAGAFPTLVGLTLLWVASLFVRR